jgi:hypothetical protein
MTKLLGEGFAKAAKLALLAAVMVAMVVTFTACGDNSEQVIKQGIEKELAEIKDPNSATIQDLSSEMGDFEELGISPDDFIKSWLTGYDYKIGAVKVDGKTATVDVDITIKQLGPVIDIFMEEVDKLIADPATGDLTEEQLTEQLGKVFTEAIDDAVPTTTSIQLGCVLNGNTWEPAANVESTLTQALIGESENM